MSGWLTSVAAAVSLGLGAFAGNKWGYRSYEAKIEETIGSVQKETERLKAKAAREAKRLEQAAQQKFDQAEQMERDALRHETDARLELEKIRAEAKTLAQDLVDARMKEAEI